MSARQALIEKLHDGESVGGLTLRELIDSDLNGLPRAEQATKEITALLLADSGERAALADTYVEGVIKRHLDAHPELIQAMAHELARDLAEDRQIDDYRDRVLA